MIDVVTCAVAGVVGASVIAIVVKLVLVNVDASEITVITFVLTSFVSTEEKHVLN